MARSLGATVDGYLDSLSRLRLIEDSPAWAPHMRSATPLQSSPTRYFVDPSLAVAALGQGPTQLPGDLNAAGFFFENLVVRDVRIYAQSWAGRSTTGETRTRTRSTSSSPCRTVDGERSR